MNEKQTKIRPLILALIEEKMHSNRKIECDKIRAKIMALFENGLWSKNAKERKAYRKAYFAIQSKNIENIKKSIKEIDNIFQSKDW